MPLRVYICPIIGSGTRQDIYRSKAWDVPGAQSSSFLPSKLDGTPASPWVISIVRANDFSAFAADPSFDDLFGGDLPASVQTRDDLITLLRSKTVGDVPLARRNAITAVLDKYGVPRTDFNLTTPLWKVMQRAVSALSEKDDNFGSNF